MMSSTRQKHSPVRRDVTKKTGSLRVRVSVSKPLPYETWNTNIFFNKSWWMTNTLETGWRRHGTVRRRSTSVDIYSTRLFQLLLHYEVDGRSINVSLRKHNQKEMKFSRYFHFGAAFVRLPLERGLQILKVKKKTPACFNGQFQTTRSV